ncbi:Outer membrane receptor protein involved in Fe transport [Tenacibaculum sp. 190130A14a]|uniref:Iron complex outermembrane recepter protein n=1 Tax=Tenacibaculum polynesiense TaxID=3137857 RepID=A0ABP1EVD7_9FLAO
MFRKLLSTIFLLCSLSFYAQTTIEGKVFDEYLEPFQSATVRIDDVTVVSDADGNFKITTSKSLPVSMQVTAFGYQTEVVNVTSLDQEINVILKETISLEEVVVSASRAPERVIESPVTIERMGITDIRNNTSPSFYDGLTNLKGVESRESSYGFKSINTRGFSTFDNTRFVQLVDGVDSSVPALNFSFGNYVGISELDVHSVEILPGASSALYGANAFNGILLMRSKSPFTYTGISTSFKTGFISQEASADDDLFYDVGVRMAYKFNDYLAAKVNFNYFEAEEWHAVDQSNTSGVGGVKIDGTRTSNTDYDGLNVYGDDFSVDLNALNPLLPSVNVSRTGYLESDLIDYKSKNLKFDGSLHYRPWKNEKLEIILNSRFTSGDLIYQGTSRYAQRGNFMQQHRLELRGENFFARGYYTANDAGKTFDLRSLGLALNEVYNPNTNWYQEYAGVFSGLVTIPGLNPGNDADARSFANRNRLQPGSNAFNAAVNQITNTSVNEGGAAIFDNTSFYHFDANYNFRDLIQWGEFQVGLSYRNTDVNSQGTLFTDRDEKINFQDFGAYAQLQKKFLDDRLKLTTSIRYDKTSELKANYSPRFALNYSLGESKNHILRASFQTGFRNPSTLERYLGLRIGPSEFVLGTANDNLGRFNVQVNNFGGGGTSTITGDYVFQNARLIENGAAAGLETIRPEKVSTYELGYRSIIGLSDNNVLEVDINGYYNDYRDFTAFKNVFVPNYLGNGTNGNTALTNGDLTRFSVYANSKADVSSYGVGIGLNTKVLKSFNLGANYTWSRFSFDESSDPSFKPGFNTPEHRFKVMFGNPSIIKNVGFNVNVRWQNDFLWESSLLDTEIDARTILDAQINWRFTNRSRIKIGGTNLTGDNYVVAPGSGLVGSMYYISWTIND